MGTAAGAGTAGRSVLSALAAMTLVFGLASISAGMAEARPASDSYSPGGAAGVVVAPAVATSISKTGTADLWVEFDQTANLADAVEIAGWKARGDHVYRELTVTADDSQADLAAKLTVRGAEFESLWIVNALYVRNADQAMLDTILADDDVTHVRAPRTYRLPEPVEPHPAQSSPDATVQSVEWGIANIGADRVWSELGARGQGIVVGNIDTGVQFDHPAVDDQYRGHNGDGTFDHAYNWWDPSQVCPEPAPCDNNGHGTHTMGTMVGDDTDDGGTNRIGVAPQAEWIAAKGCESRSCSEFALVSSGQFMLAPTDLNGENPRPELRPHVVNNSWGGSGGQTFYDEIVANWVAAGIFPVFANGNSGSACETTLSPADGPDAYAVGAYDVDNAIAPFSSRGPGRDSEIRPDISAPGVAVRSSWPGSLFVTASGTSMAAPHLAGTVALMWSAAPDIARDIDATRDLLDFTAVDMDDTTCGGTAADNNVWGEGRLDAFAAVDNAAIGPLPEVTITAPGEETSITEGDPVTFSATAVDFEGNDLSASIEWTSDIDGTLGSGASLTTTDLSWGSHTITAAAVDAPGRTGLATIKLNVVSHVEVNTMPRRVQGRHQVDLFWSGPRTPKVDIFRDGELLATVENSGFHLDNIGARGNATYMYKVCEANTPVCSDPTPAKYGK